MKKKVDTPEACLRDMQEYLWEELAEARLRALRRNWSIEVENIIDKIKRITALIGPIDPNWVVMPFLLSMGKYEGIGYRETAAKAKIPIQWFSQDEERRLREICASYLKNGLVNVKPPHA